MTQSIYEQIGGESAVAAAVEIFYKKVLADPLVNGFFDSTNMEAQAEKQRRFITMALGGPNRYTGRSMRRAHARLVEEGLNDSHFDAIVGHLGGTLRQLGVGEDTTKEIAAKLEGLRADVLSR